MAAAEVLFDDHVRACYEFKILQIISRFSIRFHLLLVKSFLNHLIDSFVSRRGNFVWLVKRLRVRRSLYKDRGACTRNI